MDRSQQRKKIIIIVGSTAVGKTALAIDLATYLDTAIISADSRQCYRELSIGVAKPSPKELEVIPHYFIDSHSIEDDVNAGVFEQYSLAATEQIFIQKEVALMVGGTGLYLKAFTDGIDIMPPISPTIRNELLNLYQENGLEWLQQEIALKDPIFWHQAEQQNPQRLLRALEIVIASGRSITEYRSHQSVERPFEIIKIGIEMPREQLIKKINQRVDQMMQDGLANEVASLQAVQSLNALQTVGYREIFAHLNKECSLSQAVEQIKINTRQYAKRQMTWFKKDPSIQWFTQSDQVLNKVLHYLSGRQ